jgi:hypothetical protein
MGELRGNLHVHSDRSDGTLAVETIAQIAYDCNLDFVGINDHHVVCSPNQYLHGVLMLMGSEFNSQHSHYLAYNACSGLNDRQVDGSKVVEHVKKNKGMGIIAHPFEKGSPLVSRGKHYPWQDWNVKGYDGIELWNQTSQWRDGAKTLNSSLCMWLFNRYKPFLAGACPQALAKWDEVCQQRHVTGLAGSDLHAPELGRGPLKFKVLDYPMLFSAVNNYVFAQPKTGDARIDSQNLIAALTQGRCWFAFDWLELAYGFRFNAYTEHTCVGMGGALANTGNVRLSVHIPHGGEIEFFHNGKPLHKSYGRKAEARVSQGGVYRVEARLKKRQQFIPWIYSNPVYIK